MAISTKDEKPCFEEDLMIRAAAVPLRLIDKDPPSEGVDRLRTTIDNLEYYFEQMRENIIATSTEALRDSQKSSGSEGHDKQNREELKKKISELSTSFQKMPDYAEGDIYAVKLTDMESHGLNSDGNFDSRVQKLLKQHDEHAKVVLDKYRGYLKQEREKKGIAIKGIAAKRSSLPNEVESLARSESPTAVSELSESKDPRLRKRAFYKSQRN